MKMIAERSQPGIQDVWQSNLEEEFRNISRIHADFNYVAMVFIHVFKFFQFL